MQKICSPQVRYQAQVTLDEYVPTRRDNIGDLVINAFVLIGILLAFAIVSGFALGGFSSPAPALPPRRRGRRADHAAPLKAPMSLHKLPVLFALD